MKLFDTLLFSFSILLMLIGIHQAMMFGFMAGYWLFMLSLGALLWYQIRRKKQQTADSKKNPSQDDKNRGSVTKKRKYKI